MGLYLDVHRPHASLSDGEYPYESTEALADTHMHTPAGVLV